MDGTLEERNLLYKLRNGDFAHPGDTKALEIIFQEIILLNNNIKDTKVLDLGCGNGGTVKYLHDKGFSDITGIDVNSQSIKNAQNKYKDCGNFINMDINALKLDKVYDLILLISSFYAIKNKHTALTKISKYSNKNAIIVIFDYSCSGTRNIKIKDFSGKKIYPINMDLINNSLIKNKWNIVKTIDISNKFIQWYTEFLNDLKKRETYFKSSFSIKAINNVTSTFLYLLDKLNNKQLGGMIILAYKN